MSIRKIYDPIEFVNEIELFTVAMIGSFITWKLLNALYDNLYEPIIDSVISSDESDKYYAIVGSHYININVVCKEIIKWLVLLLIIMLIHNIFVNR